MVTLYELEPAPGMKSARVVGLCRRHRPLDERAVGRVAVVPGRNAIGIELPNAKRETVYLRELLAADEYDDTHGQAAALPRQDHRRRAVDRRPRAHAAPADRRHHRLGQVGGHQHHDPVLLYRLPPEQCRFIMVDPKMLELSVYDGIPHLLAPVVTDPKKAIVALKWTVREMEDRYRRMSKIGVRNIAGYNARARRGAAPRASTSSRTVQTGFDQETGEAIYEKEELEPEPMPYLVVVIDEMADLMMVAGKDIEGAVQRLAQMARAAGIHLIMATQRPSVDVITGTIKANFPTRI